MKRISDSFAFAREGRVLKGTLAVSSLERLQDLLSAALGRTLALRIAIGDIAGETPAQRDAIERQARHAEAVAALEADPFVRELIERFDATLVESTVKPL